MNLLFYLQGGVQLASDATTDSLSMGADGSTTDQSIIEVMIDSWYINGPLLILSVLAVYIFFERVMAIGKALKEESNFMSKIKDYVHEGKIDSARNLCGTSDTPIARMLEKGLSRIGKPMEDIKASIENIGKLEIYNLEKNLSTLATISGAAPMIGFLGTVIGMVMVFAAIVEKASFEIADLSSGMLFAMLTTIVGLVVGILAYMAYNYLVARVSKVIHKMEASSIEFIDILEQPSR